MVRRLTQSQKRYFKQAVRLLWIRFGATFLLWWVSAIKSESRSTGELERSLGLSPVMVDKNGNPDIKVGFSEPRSDGSSNAKIANILEYGTSTQQAKPFLKPAKSAVKKQCVDAMKSAFEKEVEGL